MSSLIRLMTSPLLVSDMGHIARAKQCRRSACAIVPVIGLASLAVLSACIGPAPALRDGRTAVISGRVTAGLNTKDATTKALSEAAKVTVDHGFRYFMLVNPKNTTLSQAAVLPGADIAIKAYRKGEIRLNTPGLWDADVILSSGMKDAAIMTKIGATNSGSTATAPSR
jgi:hypothetical protein